MESVDRYDENLIAKSASDWVPRGARISNARLVNAAGERVNILTPRRVYAFEYDIEFEETCFSVNRCMLVKSMTGVELGGMMSHPQTEGTEIVEAGERMTASFRFRAVMNPGTYFLNAGILGLVDGERTYLHRIVDVLMFRIDPVPSAQATGYVDLRDRLETSTGVRGLEATR
jgi:lipopolysaccharide transport system ATP-binding protein